MTTFAIGDIQGCYDPFRRLLDQVSFEPSRDKLWLVGDLVNRGPHSLEVLRFVRELGSACTVVLGNHDLHLIAVAMGARSASANDTLAQVLAAPDSEELIAWLRHRPLLHDDPQRGYVMVHAGLPPAWDIKTASKRAQEVEVALRSDGAIEFLRGMYGNEPARWQEDLTGVARLRLITNYLTRMRFCAADGTLDLSTKGPPNSARPGFLPWFEHAERKSKQAKILFGHWAALMGKASVRGVFPLDTGCVWGGRLRAFRLEDGGMSDCAC